MLQVEKCTSVRLRYQLQIFQERVAILLANTAGKGATRYHVCCCLTLNKLYKNPSALLFELCDDKFKSVIIYQINCQWTSQYPRDTEADSSVSRKILRSFGTLRRRLSL